MSNLFSQTVKAINIGVSTFADGLRQQDAEVVQVDWSPSLTPYITHTSTGIDIHAANQKAIESMIASTPMIVGLGRAIDVIPNFKENMILHAGPPIEWEAMCGPLQGAIIGALIYEGKADNPDTAREKIKSGEIIFAPSHHHQTVGPMAGVVSPSMPVWIVENAAIGNRAYCTLNEGLGRVLRYGAYGDDVYARLKWIADELYPVLNDAVAQSGAIDIRSMIAQALHMGDECHNRNRAGTSLLLRILMPAMLRTCKDSERLARVVEFIVENDHFFLNVAMPAAKVTAAAAEGIEGSSIVTVMARNGTDFGICVSGEPDRWFTAPAGMIEGLYLPGFSAEDGNRDIGDSTITETAGYGAFAMASAPAISKFVGGTAQDALNTTLDMYEICFNEHQHFTIPSLEFRGTPLGIDVRLVMETGILPRLNTGIAHKQAGIGMVGAGIVHAPQGCFADAMAMIQTW